VIPRESVSDHVPSGRCAAWPTAVWNRILSRKPKWSTYASKYRAMWVWCGKSGQDLGIGKSENSMRSRDVLMYRSR
jgi:hypothetical protein